jgi:drug/metabolite transporter (DMT)-like permease
MSWTAALLIVASAFMHALWNLVSKRRNPTLAFFFVAASSSALIVSPALVVWRSELPHLPMAVWGLLLATGLAQAVYFSGLSGAYQHGDMSLAYPLARALPVVAVAAISILLGRGSQIGWIGLVGMVLISIGCLILPLPGFRGLRLRDYTSVVYRMAALAAAGTTAYTLIDDTALRMMRTEAGLALSTPHVTLVYIALQALSTSALLGLAALTRRPDRQELAAMARSRRQLLSGVVTGTIIMATYGLVLASMAYVRNVSYVSAFRQLSIPIGALMGLTFQGEPRYRPKIAGIIVITVGLLLVGLG